MERIFKWTPFGFCFAESLRGIKHFEGSKKARNHLWKKKGHQVLWFWPSFFLKMSYPPKGLCKADTEGSPIVFTYVLFCLRKRILDFSILPGNPPFWDVENVLSSEGTSACRLHVEHLVFGCSLELSRFQK